MINGFNDLYLIDRKGVVLKRLTNNPQDERDAVFGLDGKKIVFSGEMMSADGLEPNGRDLFQLNIETLATDQLTNLPGDEREPTLLSDGSIVFVRDRNQTGEVGFNLYRLISSSQPPVQMTDMVGGAFLPHYSAVTDSLYYVGFYAGEKHIYQYQAPHFTGRGPVVSSILGEGEAALNLKQKALTQALNTWPEGLVSPLIQGSVQPYKWKGSTDLFLPFFFYSSLDGFVLADIWQFSDLLGRHQVQQQFQYASSADLYDAAVFYTYARFRPQFTFGVRSQRFYRDVDQMHQRRNNSVIGLLTYPLDRVNAIQAGAGINDQEDRFLDNSEVDYETADRFWVAGLIHDTVSGRYLVPTQGRRVGLYYQQGAETLKGNQSYKTQALDAAQYFRLPRESTLATRLFYGRSTGEEVQVFRLGGIDRIRGVSSRSLANKKSNVAIASGEMRIRLSYLNARTKFLYPDFFFKAAYLILFDDIGYGWNSRTEREAFELSRTGNSAGIGISWPTFILQTFKLDFTVLYAKRTDDGSDIWFVTLGPSF